MPERSTAAHADRDAGAARRGLAPWGLRGPAHLHQHDPGGLTYFDDLALYHDAQRLLTFEAPVAFLYWSQQASLVSPRVHAWTLAPWDPGFPISRLTDLAVDPR